MKKRTTYENTIPKIRALLGGETDMIANAANICAVLTETFQFFWTGYYFVKGNELVLGPFQGPVACTRIQNGKGVCGHVLKNKEAAVVDDVHKFPGHIACNPDSKSEIVIPVFKDDRVIAILDIDSDRLAHFDDTDLHYLTEINALLSEYSNA